ncbi:hypothetical protein [Amycolatopsis coloradensis]|uniref:hypothetical protein n=1 Tax=Amycolatopsis coloradensis TaxID=76021 RepID=UPI0013012BCA|nr:hypothetical protein [Amycolatopsis coloradensis]
MVFLPVLGVGVLVPAGIGVYFLVKSSAKQPPQYPGPPQGWATRTRPSHIAR